MLISFSSFFSFSISRIPFESALSKQKSQDSSELLFLGFVMAFFMSRSTLEHYYWLYRLNSELFWTEHIIFRYEVLAVGGMV
jgi:hypothetical protein